MANAKNTNKKAANPNAGILSKLKAGEIATIASKTGYSASHVSNVLAGRRTNSAIVTTASKITSRRK